MSEHEDLKEIKRLKAELLRRHSVDAVQVCEQARTAILWHLIPRTEHCALAEGEIERCFVFRFAKWDGAFWKRETFSVRKEMIEDGIMSEQRLKAALWDTLGRLRGMVVTNSAEYIRLHGHSDDYEPIKAQKPCGHPAGPSGKLEVMRLRAELGQHIWHPRDCEAMASPAESDAMRDEVLRIARETKYANRAGS